MNAFQRCLEELDVAGARLLWAEAMPHLPQPKNDGEMLFTLHHARTQAESIALRLRAYSHRWLLDNGYPSGLPDRLKPKAERLYPKVVDAVGISVNARSALLAPIVPHIERAMSDAVLDCYADGHKEPEIVKPRMFEAKANVVRQLLGIR